MTKFASGWQLPLEKIFHQTTFLLTDPEVSKHVIMGTADVLECRLYGGKSSKMTSKVLRGRNFTGTKVKLCNFWFWVLIEVCLIHSYKKKKKNPYLSYIGPVR